METLKVEERKIKGRKVKFLRQRKIIPAIIYGKGLPSKPIQVPYLEFKKIFTKVGQSSLIRLAFDNKENLEVLIQAIQRHPVTGEVEHIDFYQVKTGEKITAEIELKFQGQSRAVKELGGVFVPQISKIKVECLPEELVPEILVDISKIDTFEDVIKIKDLNLPPKIKIFHRPEEIVAMVLPPSKIEEVEIKKPLETPPEEPKAEKTEEIK